MSHFGEIAGRVAPIFVMLALGYLGRKGRFVSAEGVAGIKTFVARFSLPPVIFLAFSAASFDSSTGITFVAVFASCLLALGIGLGLDVLRKRSSLRPFLMTAFEAGMLGFPLYAIAFGQAGIPRFAMADLGEICFTFSILIPLLDARSGGKPTLRHFSRRLVTNPVIWAVVLGILCALSGFAGKLFGGAGGAYLKQAFSFVAGPTGALVLFVVGYDLDFGWTRLKEVLPTIGLRYLVVIPLFFGAWAAISGLSPDADVVLRNALLVLFLMPASFAITVFGKAGEDSRMLSTTLSVNTLVSVIALGVVTAFV